MFKFRLVFERRHPSYIYFLKIKLLNRVCIKKLKLKLNCRRILNGLFKMAPFSIQPMLRFQTITADRFVETN